MKTILWEVPGDYHMEYFSLDESNRGPALTGTIVLLLNDLPTRVSYRVECDTQWRTQRVSIEREHAGEHKSLNLLVDDGQVWRANGSAVSFATGFYDVDLEITPATNTLPIRRLALEDGQSSAVDALWVRFPELSLEHLPQRYTRISRFSYRYEAPTRGFETILDVDELALISHYHGFWRRVGR